MSDGGGTFIFLRSEGHAGKTKVNIQEQEEASMPKTKFESVIFTAVTAWIMVYIMTLYNTVSATGTFVNATFWIALKGMWLEFVIIFLCAYFLSGPVARHFAFRVVKPGDRPIAIILAIQTFTVVSQVALASILGVWHGYGFTSQFIPNYLATYCRNFIMALPVQLFLAGPIARALFRLLFRRGNGGGEKKIGREVREEGAAE